MGWVFVAVALWISGIINIKFHSAAVALSMVCLIICAIYLPSAFEAVFRQRAKTRARDMLTIDGRLLRRPHIVADVPLCLASDFGWDVMDFWGPMAKGLVDDTLAWYLHTDTLCITPESLGGVDGLPR